MTKKTESLDDNNDKLQRISDSHYMYLGKFVVEFEHLIDTIQFFILKFLETRNPSNYLYLHTLVEGLSAYETISKCQTILLLRFKKEED